ARDFRVFPTATRHRPGEKCLLMGLKELIIRFMPAVLVCATAAVPAFGFTPIRVNAGGSAYTDSMGRAWSADAGTIVVSSYATTHAITGTTDPTLYQSERHGTSFQYQYAVPNGVYTVNLKFAEIWWTAPGQRVFNVAINNTAVLSNFDMVAQGG